MSILSDRDIMSRCIVPDSYYVNHSDRFPIYGDYQNKYPNVPVYGEDQTAYQVPYILRVDKDKPDNYISPMIEPFIPHQVREEDGRKIVSYGLSSGGYDVRLDRKFKIFTNINNALIDPLNIQDDYYVDHEGDYCIIPPNSYVLGLTMETFNIPRDIIVVALGKSTYARLGLAVNVTPVEPQFRGRVVVEIANQSQIPAKVYAGMGISQFMFHQLSSPCKVSYNDRGGKYQGQDSLQTALV